MLFKYSLLTELHSVVSHKNVTKAVMSMVSLLRLKGFGGQAGVSVEVSGQTDRLGSWKA